MAWLTYRDNVRNLTETIGTVFDGNVVLQRKQTARRCPRSSFMQFKSAQLTAKVVADHVHNLITDRSTCRWFSSGPT